MAREKKSMIGFDPLAWLEDEVDDENNNDVEKSVSQAEIETGIKTQETEETEQVESVEEVAVESEVTEASTEKPKVEENVVEVEKMEQQSAEHLSEHAAILLSSVQDISKVQVLKADILVLIKDNDEIDINGEEVERIDGSSLQLLCALFEYAEHNALVLNWIKPSDALKQSVKILGMQDVLNLH